MRGKIIGVFSLVVLVVVGLLYALSRASLSDGGSKGDASRALAAANAQLQVEGLVLERWLHEQAQQNPRLREIFNIGTAAARADAAKSAADRVLDAARSAPELSGIPITLIALVDKDGVVLSRNGSGLMRGDDLGAAYPRLEATLAKGTTGSDVWVNRKRNEQLLASYAPVFGPKGEILGGLVAGSALNDERLTNASNKTTGGMIVAAVKSGDSLDVVAKSRGVSAELVQALTSAPAKDSALQSLATGQVLDVRGLPREYAAASGRIEGYGGEGVLVGIAHLDKSAAIGTLLYPALGVLALGLLLVFVGAHFLDVFISRPVSQIEEGLLAIINGRHDQRFELQHDVLGGIATHLNTMLNQLLGVQEDETDAEGRPSRAPTAAGFQDALSVDERVAEAGGDPLLARALREEPDDLYYTRIFHEYVTAKRTLGDPVDHITREDFVSRIMASERDMAHKHGNPVRYKVEVRGKEVVLLAVPLV